MDYPLEHTVDDAQKIRIRRIKAGSLFQLVAAAVFTIIVPLFIFFGILALFGFDTVHVNRRQVHGVEGLIYALIMAPIFSLILSVIGWLILYVGVFIWGHFKPITISYVSADEPKA
jgi:hypothetical protein